MRPTQRRPCRLPGAWLWRPGSAVLRRRVDRVEGALAVLALLLSCLALPLGSFVGSHPPGGHRAPLHVAAGPPAGSGAGQGTGSWRDPQEMTASSLTYTETTLPPRAGPDSAAAGVGAMASVAWLAVVWGGFAWLHHVLDRRRLRQWEVAWRGLTDSSS
jgi:hypothetical protein